MRYYEEQQFYMVRDVGFFLKKNKEKVSSKVPALNEAVDLFLEKFKAVEQLVFSKKNIVSVSSGQKKSVKEGLADALMVLADMLHAHHYKGDKKESVTMKEGSNKNPKAIFSYTAAKLCKMSSPGLCRVSEQLIAAAKKVRRLKDYGITEGEIREAEAYYEEYKGVKDKPTQSKKEVAKRNRAISEGIRECISMLDDRIDQLMRLATRNDDALGREYKGRRVILGKMSGRPSDRESRYRQSRKKKIDAHELIRRYVRVFRKNKMPVTEAILYGTYARRQAYSNSKLEVALILNERDAGNAANSALVSMINKKFPAIHTRYFSQKKFEGNDALINRIKSTGVKVEI